MERMIEPQERLLGGSAELARQTRLNVVHAGLLAAEVNIPLDDVRTQLENLATRGLVRFTCGHAGDDVVVLLPRGRAALTPSARHSA